MGYVNILLRPISQKTIFDVSVKLGFGVVIDDDCIIGQNVFIGHNSILRNKVIIDDAVTIGHLCLIEANVKIGKGTTIQSQCHITKSAVIEDLVFLGPSVITCNDKNISSHGRAQVIGQKLEGPLICHGARIGAGCLVVPGVKIGENAFIAAGSLVSKNVPAAEFWAGRPARKVKNVPQEEWV